MKTIVTTSIVDTHPTFQELVELISKNRISMRTFDYPSQLVLKKVMDSVISGDAKLRSQPPSSGFICTGCAIDTGWLFDIARMPLCHLSHQLAFVETGLVRNKRPLYLVVARQHSMTTIKYDGPATSLHFSDHHVSSCVPSKANQPVAGRWYGMENIPSRDAYMSLWESMRSDITTEGFQKDIFTHLGNFLCNCLSAGLPVTFSTITELFGRQELTLTDIRNALPACTVNSRSYYAYAEANCWRGCRSQITNLVDGGLLGIRESYFEISLSGKWVLLAYLRISDPERYRVSLNAIFNQAMLQPDTPMLVQYTQTRVRNVGHCELISYNEFLEDHLGFEDIDLANILATGIVCFGLPPEDKMASSTVTTKRSNRKPRTETMKMGNNNSLNNRLSKKQLKATIAQILTQHGYKKGSNFVDLGQRFLDGIPTGKSVNMYDRLDDALYGTGSKVKSALDREAATKIFNKEWARFRNECEARGFVPPKWLFATLVIQDDWDSVLSFAKGLGNKALDFVKANLPTIKEVGTNILNGQYGDAVSNIAKAVLSDSTPHTITSVESKQNEPQTQGALANFASPMYVTANSYARRNVSTKHILDISKGYLTGVFGLTGRPDASPSTLPDLSMTKHMTLATFSTSVTVGNNLFMRIAPWNAFSNKALDTDTRSNFCSIANYTSTKDDPGNATNYEKIPNTAWTFVTPVTAGQAANWSQVRLNSMHVEVNFSYSAFNTSFVLWRACTNSLTSDNATTPNDIWYNDTTLSQMAGSVKQSNIGTTNVYEHFIMEALDKPEDSINSYVSALDGYFNSPSMVFKLVGTASSSSTAVITMNVIVRASVSVFPTPDGLLSIPIWVPEAGPSTGALLQNLFAQYPWLRLAPQSTWDKLAQITTDAPDYNADHLFDLLSAYLDNNVPELSLPPTGIVATNEIEAL